jgi:hypothetical protein
VDGLDAQPARCFDGAGEEAARLRQRIGIQPRAFAQLGKLRAQGGIGLHRPFAKAAEQAVLHLCRGGLGVGEAEDVLRFHPAQKQPGDAVCQHAGLARSGIGGKPGRSGWVSGLHLPFRGGVGHGASPTVSALGGAVVSHSP